MKLALILNEKRVNSNNQQQLREVNKKMIDLNKNRDDIKTFLRASIERFQSENETPNTIGVYCCPWAGWLTTNFNITKKSVETEHNCPDFEFVEFDFLDLEEWQNEYESETPKFKLNGMLNIHNHDLGDEHFNQLFFNYLKPIVMELKEHYKTDFLLQMLDSNLAEEL